MDRSPAPRPSLCIRSPIAVVHPVPSTGERWESFPAPDSVSSLNVPGPTSSSLFRLAHFSLWLQPPPLTAHRSSRVPAEASAAAVALIHFPARWFPSSSDNFANSVRYQIHRPEPLPTSAPKASVLVRLSHSTQLS